MMKTIEVMDEASICSSAIGWPRKLLEYNGGDNIAAFFISGPCGSEL